jgi:hypothetical protein
VGLLLAAVLTELGCGRAPSPARPASAARAVPALRVVPDRIDGRPWLAAEATRASAAGAGPLQVLGADVASEGDRLGAFVEIPDGECALAFARSSPSIVDVDLYAYEDDGSAFATDESPDAEAAILICPPHPRRLYIVARVMAGAGILSVGVQSVPRAAAAAVGRTTGARGLPGDESGRLDAWPGLEAKIRAHRRAIGARWDDVRRVAVPLSPRAPTRISAGIEPGRCIDVLVTPSEEIASFELIAEAADGRIIGRGRDNGRDRSLLLCSAASAQISLALRSRAAEGLVVITIGRSAVGAEPELAGARVIHVSQTLDLDAARRELDRGLKGSGYAAPKPVATGAARVGSQITVPIDLPAGCARIDVLAGKPLVDVAASLWDDKGALRADGRGGAGAQLFPCGPGGAARLDVEALESPGPFAVELRKDAAAPPLLVSHPIAAARLLARLSAAGEARGAAAAVAAELVSLDSASRKAAPLLALGGDGCVEVIAALDSGGTGIALRLVDGASGEGAVTRSRYVVADRICGRAGGKAASYELRLEAGKAEALVLTRLVSGP